MKTLTTLALLCATMITHTAYAHAGHDISYIFNNTTQSLLIIAKPSQSIADACASAARAGVAARTVKVKQMIKGKYITVKCN